MLTAIGVEIATQGSWRMLSGLPFGKELNASGRSARERWLGGFATRLDEARRDAETIAAMIEFLRSS